MPRILKTNPFRPGKPITDPEFFSGRKEELSILIDALYQTGTGNSRHIIVTGARGIGKSSLVNQIDKLIDGNQDVLNELDIDAGSFKFNFHVCKHRATTGQSISHIVSSLLDQVPTRFSKDNVKDVIGKFLTKWKFNLSVGGIVGAEYQSNATADISTDFVHAVKTFWTAARSEVDGVIFIIDEVDTVAETDLAPFCKITTEALTDAGIEQVAFVLVGITGAMERLKLQHPSVGRIFGTIEVLPMTHEESADIIAKSLKDSNVDIAADVSKKIIELSGGFPAPVHLLGYHAFEEDTDQFIDESDFERAIDKVIAIVKREELNSLYQKAGTGEYRRILHTMALYTEDVVPLRHVAEVIGRRSDAMSSYMNALIERGIVERVDRAQYKISDPLLKIYISKLGVLQGGLFDDEIQDQ